MTASWSAPATSEVVQRRAAGRNQYNSLRRFRRDRRRIEVAKLLCKYGVGRRGVQTRIADELGVSLPTIHRDVHALLEPTTLECPSCRRPMAMTRWKALKRRGDRGLGDLESGSSASLRTKILASEMAIDLLPRVLADLGLYVNDDDRLEHENGRPLPSTAPTLSEVTRRAEEALRARGAA